MQTSEYAVRDGTGLAELVRSKQVKRVELVEAAIEIAERRNPEINSICFKAYDQALALANKQDDGGGTDGPLEGVPMLLKDLNGEVEGWPELKGCRALADYVSPHTTNLVKRYFEAGLNPIGKATTPEFGLIAVTESDAYGDTRNPWNLNHTPGASSGGSAASVAAGIVPIAHANDGGGSIRIPASCSGLVGMKPSRGRMPQGPLGALAFDLGMEHVVTRSVRDSALVLDATHGEDPGAPYVAPITSGTYLSAVTTAPPKLRVAFSTDYWTNGGPIHQECVAAVQNTARILEELGHAVEETRPQVDYGAVTQSFMAVWTSMAAASVDSISSDPNLDQFEQSTLDLAGLGRKVSGGQLVSAREHLLSLGRLMSRFHDTYDIYVTTVLGTPPIKIGDWRRDTAFVPDDDIQGQFMLCSPVANATGQPSISLPLHMTQDGLPVGVMITAAYGREDLLYQIAGQLEEALPWADRTPPNWA